MNQQGKIVYSLNSKEYAKWFDLTYYVVHAEQAGILDAYNSIFKAQQVELNINNVVGDYQQNYKSCHVNSEVLSSLGKSSLLHFLGAILKLKGTEGLDEHSFGLTLKLAMLCLDSVSQEDNNEMMQSQDSNMMEIDQEPNHKHQIAEIFKKKDFELIRLVGLEGNKSQF
jgi:hypothetical protein